MSTETNTITITKLQYAEGCGDWHDKPLRYKVEGPNAEVQKFSTKKDSEKYLRIRRSSSSSVEATSRFCK